MLKLRRDLSRAVYVSNLNWIRERSSILLRVLKLHVILLLLIVVPFWKWWRGERKQNASICIYPSRSSKRGNVSVFFLVKAARFRIHRWVRIVLRIPGSYLIYNYRTACRYQAGDYTGQLLQEVTAMRPARPTFIPVHHSQFPLQRQDSWSNKTTKVSPSSVTIRLLT